MTWARLASPAWDWRTPNFRHVVNAAVQETAAQRAYLTRHTTKSSDGKPFPDGSKTVKIAWKPEKSTDAPDPATVVPGTLNGVGFMVRDSKRFADSGGWGWAQFKYDAASEQVCALHRSRQATPAKRRQMRFGVPHNREGKRLRFHGVQKR